MSLNHEIIHLNNVDLPFVLLGPRDGYRGVLARSTLENLDLVGLDSSIEFKSNVFQRPSLAFLSPYSVHRNIVRVLGARIDEDGRGTYYAFAWRGAIKSSQKVVIRKILSDRSFDIDTAIYNNDQERLRWLLAPIISLCQRANENFKAKRYLVINAILFFIVIYVALFALFMIKGIKF